MNTFSDGSSTLPASTKGVLHEHPAIYFVGAAFVLALPLPKNEDRHPAPAGWLFIYC